MTFHDESHFFLSRIFRWQEKKGGIHTTHYDNDSLLVCFLHFRIIITCVCSCGRCAVWSFNNATHNCNLIWRVNETQPKYTLCRFMNVIKLDFWFSVSYEPKPFRSTHSHIEINKSKRCRWKEKWTKSYA